MQTLSSEDLDACEAAIAAGSRSFHVASRLLPKRVRRPAFGLYAFCRLADDVVDLSGEEDALATLHARLDAAYSGLPWDHPADRALADLARNHRLPREWPLALFEGFAWDREGRRYADISALRAYGARVAGTVGVMMTHLMGVRDPGAYARACDLGIAMQLTNIARDVGEDARAGRLYLPLDWLAEAGVDAQAFLADPKPSPGLTRVVSRLLAEADRLYARAREGVARLPLDCRPAILAAASIYGAIGHEARRRGCDTVSTRARVSGRAKLALALRAPLEAALLRRGPSAPCLAEAAFLVEAAGSLRPHAVTFSERFVRMLELFERLERLEQAGR